MSNSLDVLIVGGGNNQCELISCARNRGLRTVITDINFDPPGRGISDAFVQLDTRDKEGNLAVARKYGVKAVVTDQTDAAVPTAAYVAESLGLPGIGYDCALAFTNKLAMRMRIRDSYPEVIPEFHFFDHPSRAKDFLVDNHKIVSAWLSKPHNSQGSRGVHRLVKENMRDQLWESYTESNFTGLLLEPFIQGEEYSVEAFVDNGVVHNLAVTSKEHYSSNPCIDLRDYYLGDVNPKIEEVLYRVNTQLLQLLDFRNGSTHAEYMVNDDCQVFLMEVAGRGGGGNISGKIIPYLTGFYPTEALLDFALDIKREVKYENYRNKFSIMRFLDLPLGKYEQVTEISISEDWILHFEFPKKVKFEAKPVRDSRDRLGYFIVTGTTPEQARTREEILMSRIRETLRFERN